MKNRSTDMLYVAAWVMSLNGDEDFAPGTEWDPPEEMQQFAFARGEWAGTCNIHPENSPSLKCHISWKTSSLLDGWAWQDQRSLVTWQGTRLQQSIFLRSFSTELEVWRVVEMQLPGQKISEFQGTMDDDALILQGQGEGGMIRECFFDLYEDSFTWRQDTSKDGRFWETRLEASLKRQ